MKEKIKFSITMLVLMLFSLAQLNAQSWHIYDGSQLPEDAGYSSADVTGKAIVHSIIDDPDIPGNKLYEYYVDSADSKQQWEANFGEPVDYITVVTRMKSSLPDSFIGVSNIRLYNGVDRVVFKLEDGRINPDNTVLNENYNMDGTQWHIFRFVMDSALVKVYVDERPRPVIIDTSNSPNSSTYFRFGDGSDGDEYGGQVDWIVWDTSGAYPPGAGAVIPQALLYPDPPALMASWLFNGSLDDVVGNADGTLNGGTDVYVESLLDSALDLSVPDSVIMIASADSTKHLVFGMNSFSISCLTNHNPAGSILDEEQYLVVKGDMGGELSGADRKGNWYGLATKENEIRFIIDDDVKKVQLGAPGDLWIPNAYNLIVGVRDTEQDSLFLYLNGVKIGSKVDEAANVIPDSMPVQIGGLVWRNDRGVDGYIEEVNIWNYALSPTEIGAMWLSYPSQIPSILFPLENILVGDNISDPDDFSVWMTANWDADSGYLSIIVVDDVIFTTGENPWDVDNIEIYMDMDNSKIPTWPRNRGWDPVSVFDDNDYQLRVLPDSSWESFNSLGGVRMEYTETDSGYIVDINFAWDSLMSGFVPAAGTLFGFDLLVSDNDNDPYFRDQISLFSPSLMLWNDPSLWGTVQFLEYGLYMGIPDETPPSAPANLVATVDEDDVTLTWDASVDNETEVFMYVIVINGEEAGEMFAEETGNSFTVSDLPDGTYNFIVVAIDNYWNVSELTAMAMAIIDTEVGIEDIDASFSIYPVPASEVIFINAESIEKVELFNLVGQSLISIDAINSKTVELDISDLSAGTYIIKIRTEGQVFSKQLIIE